MSGSGESKRNGLKPLVVLGASTALVAASAAPVSAAVEAPAAVAAPEAVAAPAVVDPEPGYATKQRPLLTIASDGMSTVRARGKYMTITLNKADVGEYTASNKVYRIRGTANLRREWSQMGQDKRGSLLGVTKAGKPLRLWVRWGPMQANRDGTLQVTAYPRAGKVFPDVRRKAKYPLYSAKKSVTKKAKLTTASITAVDERSEKWQFNGFGQTGSVTTKGRNFYIDFNNVTPKLPGVQPSGKAALIRTSWLSDSFQTMAKYGAKPRLVLTGETKDGKDIAEVFWPKKLIKKGTTLSIRANQGTKFSNKFLKSLEKIKRPGFMLETSNPGKVRSYVLVTGDSIASGEGASMGGTYLNGNLALDEKPTPNPLDINKCFDIPGGGIATPVPNPDPPCEKGQAKIVASETLYLPIPVTDPTQIDRWQKFCETVDLACTSAKVENGKLNYQRDPGIVYEKGTWENKTLNKYGFSCHRSKTAPGTWLARYWNEVRGLDVGSINLACSGATTAAILPKSEGGKSYLGQEQQATQVKRLADWVPVTHVVNTIGANDIKFSTIAKDCIFAPINSLLPIFTGGGGGSIVDLLFPTNGNPTPLVMLADDIKSDGKGGIRSANTFFSPGYKDAATGKTVKGTLCSQEDGKQATEAIKSLPQKIAKVIEELHKAAPDAKIVNSNYPNEVPASKNTYFPRQQWWDATRATWLMGGDVELDFLKAITPPHNVDFKSAQYTDLNGSAACPSGTTPFTGMRSYLLCGGTTAVTPEFPPCVDKSKPATIPPAAKACTPGEMAAYPAFTNPAMDQFFDAAADASNPAHNTAQLMSKNLYSFTETMAGFGSASFSPLTVKVPLFGNITANFVNQAQDSYRYAQWWLKFLTEGGILDTLGLGAIMYGLDQDWANETIINGLNEAVDDGVALADPKGEYTVIVDQTQTFNGRELGGKFVGSDENPLFHVWGYNGTKNPGAHPKKDIPAAGPTASRAQYVNNFFAGQALPIVCPSSAVMSGEVGCIGSPQEALHPNWLGQAAEGQCIVAVVTGAFGSGGNACVRSLGDETTKAEEYTAANIDAKTKNGTGAMLFTDVNGDDLLCLQPFAPVREDGKKGIYTSCQTGFNPMPTWSKDWENGQVKWQGKKVHWG